MAEVVPVSSSAQLVLLPWLLGWPPPRDRTTFAAGLHAGSCLGIGWSLRSELRSLDRRTLLLVAGASVPAAVAGALAADVVEERLGRPPQLAALLAAAGLLMWAVDARAERAGGAPSVQPRGRGTPSTSATSPGPAQGAPVAATVPSDRQPAGLPAGHAGAPVAATVLPDRQPDGLPARREVAPGAATVLPDGQPDGLPAGQEVAPAAATVPPGRQLDGHGLLEPPLDEVSATPDSRREAGTLYGRRELRSPYGHRAGRAARGRHAERPVRAGIQGVGAREAAWAGCAQVVALVPGVSRSGATLTALRAAGVSRAEAERFSLLMSLPVTAGAAALTLLRADRADLLPLAREIAPGAVAAGLAGGLAARRRAARPGTPLRGAALYRLVLATAVVLRQRSRKDGT